MTISALIILNLMTVFPSTILCAMTEGNTTILRLYNQLFDDYNTNVRPVLRQNDSIRTNLDFALYNIGLLKEMDETIEISLYLRLYWNDAYLKWKPTEYDNISSFKVPLDLVWAPDIFCYQSLVMTPILTPKTTTVSIKSDGSLYVSIFYIMVFHCTFDITWFPFDQQNCSLRFSSYTYSKSEINLLPKNAKGDLSYYTKNSQWILVSMDSSAPHAPKSNSISNVYFFLHIRRDPLYYIFATIVPSTLITTLSLIGLFSPFSNTGERQEKISMGLTTLLTMSVLLLMVAEQMPRTSQSIPLLAKYILFQLTLASLATLATIFIMHIHRRGLNGDSLPLKLRRLMKIKIGENKPRITVDDKDVKSLDRNLLALLTHIQFLVDRLLDKEDIDSNLDAWRHLSSKLDFICLLFFLSLNLGSLVAIFMIGYHLGAL